MVNRRRNLNLHVRLTKEEIELIKTVATLKGMTLTDTLIEWAKKDYEKIKEETNNETGEEDYVILNGYMSIMNTISMEYLKYKRKGM